jgi:hypothetical protein
MNWTPGPWAASAPGDYSDYSGDCSVITGDDTRVCVALGTDQEATANARLIAAAPTMAEYIIGRARYGDGAAIAIVEALGVKL